MADIPALLSTLEEVLQNSLLVVDTTFTPRYIPPVDDRLIVVGSMTKYDQPDENYMGGRISASPEVIEAIRGTRIYNDSVMLPIIAKQYFRQIAGTEKRWLAAQALAVEIATVLEDSTVVDQVSYVGLTAHGQHDLAARLYGGGGGVMYCHFSGGTDAAKLFADAWQSSGGCQIAVSFGSPQTRILPFCGPLEEYTGSGWVRIAAGYDQPESDVIRTLQDLLREI